MSDFGIKGFLKLPNLLDLDINIYIYMCVTIYSSQFHSFKNQKKNGHQLLKPKKVQVLRFSVALQWPPDSPRLAGRALDLPI